MVTLPDKYCESMKKLLGEKGFGQYIDSFRDKPLQAIRINTAKTDLEEWKKICPFDTEEIPWCQNGFIINGSTKAEISKHPYYFAGLYYIQEPSAMVPASIIKIEDGDKVLDLCAAPGGKAVEIAARLNGSGFLVANDISASRAAALAKNLQMSGAVNVAVTVETPEHLSLYFKEYFDKILLDVPCSGEGMFRRKPDMVKDWQDKGPGYYSAIQKDILREAYSMLKPGGNIVYSTCTFSLEEDEGMMQWFIDTYKDMEICTVPHREGFSYGMPELAGGGSEELKRCIRIFPHITKGEGHFATLLHKKDVSLSCYEEKTIPEKNDKKQKNIQNKNNNINTNKWQEEIKEFVPEKYYKKYYPVQNKDTICLVPEETRRIKHLRYIQNGIIAGRFKKHFEPSCQLALSEISSHYKNRLMLKTSGTDVIKYLKGETLNIEENFKGWVLVTVDGFPLGWGKADGCGRLKNKYHAGWRMM